MTGLVFLVGYSEELPVELKQVLNERGYKVAEVPLNLVETFAGIQCPQSIIFTTDGKNKILFETAKKIHKKHPRIKIVFIAGCADKQLVANVFLSGGRALLLKRHVRARLLKILGHQDESKGGGVFDPSTFNGLLDFGPGS